MPRKIKKQSRLQGARSRSHPALPSHSHSLAHVPKYLVLSALALAIVLGGILASDIFFEPGITGQQFQFCGPNSCSVCSSSQCGPAGCIYDINAHQCTHDSTPPSAPGSLSSTSQTSSSIDFGWAASTDNVRIQGYKVYRGAFGSTLCGLFPSSGYVQIASLSSAATTYTDSGLTRKTDYCYKINAYDPAGNNANSSNLGVSTLAAVPSVPQNLAATATAIKVSLGWSAPADDGGSAIGYYKIYRGTTSGALSAYGDTCAPNPVPCNNPVLSFDDNSVLTGQTYFYQVSAFNSIGESLKTSEQSSTPSSTTTTQAGSTTTTSSSCDPASSQCSACATQSACAAPCLWNAHLSVCAAPTTSSSTTTTPGTTSSTTTTAPPDTTPPAKVLGLNPTSGNSQVLLNWTANIEVDLSDYRIYQNNVKIATVPLGGKPPVGGKPPSHPTFYTVTGLTNGVEYTFQVSAADASGNEGLKSDSAKSTPTPAGVADTTPPAILSTNPTNQTMNAPKTSEIKITFSESMKQTETEEAISVSPDFAFTKSWSGNVLTLTPALDYNVVYAITIGTGAQDLSGNSLASDYRFLFATAPAPTTTTPATTAQTTTTTTPPPAIVSVATTSGAQQEALSAILEANKTIYENQGKKDVVGALKLYSNAIKAYNVAEYINAKDLALQSKSAVKEFATTTTKPTASGPDVVWISVGAVLLVLIAGAAVFIYMQNKKAAEEGKDGKKEVPKETPQAPKEKPEAPIAPATTPTASRRLR